MINYGQNASCKAREELEKEITSEVERGNVMASSCECTPKSLLENIFLSAWCLRPVTFRISNILGL